MFRVVGFGGDDGFAKDVDLRNYEPCNRKTWQEYLLARIFPGRGGADNGVLVILHFALITLHFAVSAFHDVPQILPVAVGVLVGEFQ